MIMQLLMDPGIPAIDIRDDEDDGGVDGSGHSSYGYQR